MLSNKIDHVKEMTQEKYQVPGVLFKNQSGGWSLFCPGCGVDMTLPRPPVFYHGLVNINSCRCPKCKIEFVVIDNEVVKY